MRRWVPHALVGALVAGGLVLAAPAAAAPIRHSVTVGHPMHRGETLVSPHGRYAAVIGSAGRLVLRTSAGRTVWRTPAAGRNAHLTVAQGGRMFVVSGSRAGWQTRTAGSGHANVLRLRDNGVLALTADGLTVWTSRIGASCPRTHGKRFVVDVSRQLARMCSNGQQLRATWVTTGAVARGNGTPRGRWHVQAKVRNTTLYPAAGGAYPVHYWVPYDGAYGIHDSPWQHFAYGSAKYKTKGSHGCIHVPARMMGWFFHWVRVGTTTVRIIA